MNKQEKLIYYRKWTKEHREKGLCTRCNNKRLPGESLCRKHKAIVAKEKKERDAKRLASGLCRLCGIRKVVPGHTMCRKHLLYQKKHSQKFREKALEKGLCYCCGDPREATSPSGKCLKCLDRQREITKNKIKERKARIIEAYGGRCACCGEREPAFLTIDHINNDGNRHRKEVGNVTMYAWLERRGYPKDNFQLLCFNCNVGKKINGGICPHKQSS